MKKYIVGVLRALARAKFVWLIALIVGLGACKKEESRDISVRHVASSALNVSTSLILCSNSRLLFEGGLTPVGVVSGMYPKDFARLFPFLGNINQSSERIIWAYELVPEVVRIEGTQATVIGKPGKSGEFYFGMVPSDGIEQVSILFSESSN